MLISHVHAIIVFILVYVYALVPTLFPLSRIGLRTLCPTPHEYLLYMDAPQTIHLLL
jgi:hypothetical protein